MVKRKAEGSAGAVAHPPICIERAEFHPPFKQTFNPPSWPAATASSSSSSSASSSCSPRRLPTRLCVVTAMPFSDAGRILVATLDVDSLAICALQVVDATDAAARTHTELLRATAVADATLLLGEYVPRGEAFV